MSTIISAIKQARLSSLTDAASSHGFGHSLPVVATMAPARAGSANAEALNAAAGHESGGASAGSEEESEASSGTTARHRKLPGTNLQGSHATQPASVPGRIPSSSLVPPEQPCRSNKRRPLTAAPHSLFQHTSTPFTNSGLNPTLPTQLPGSSMNLRVQPARDAPATPPSLSAATLLHGAALLGSDNQMRLLGDPCIDASQRCSHLTPKNHLALLEYIKHKGSTRSQGYLICLGSRTNVQCFMSGTGLFMLYVKELFAACGNTSASVCDTFLSRSVWGSGNALAYLLVSERHMTGLGFPGLFAPVEVVLDVLEAWWETPHRGTTEEKLCDSVALLFEDLKAHICKVKVAKAALDGASLEEFAELGAGAVQAHSGALTDSSHLEMSADVSKYISDPFPMASTKDSLHVKRVKLTTAVNNMLRILHPKPAVCTEVRDRVDHFDDVQLKRFMIGEYGNLRNAGVREDPIVLGMFLRDILAGTFQK